MNLSNDQIAQLLRLIDVSHLEFILHEIGYDILTSEDIFILQANGINVYELSGANGIEDMYKLGMLSNYLTAKELKNTSYEELKSFIASGKFKKLTDTELAAINFIKKQAYLDIKGLGNKIKDDISQSVINTGKTREQYAQAIRDVANQAIYSNQSKKQFAIELGKKTKDWQRDLDRIAAYTMHEAYDHGRAMQIAHDDGFDAIVWKQVLDHACQSCVDLYLSHGVNSEPILFKLSTLLKNGNNIGRKKNEWKPVVGATHPWCRCTLHHYTKNTLWDGEVGAFRMPKQQKNYKGEVKITVSRD